MGSLPSSEAEACCKLIFFVFGRVVIIACVCFVAVVHLNNSLEVCSAELLMHVFLKDDHISFGVKWLMCVSVFWLLD